MKKILLDTNAYSSLLGGDVKILDTLGIAETVYMSIFVLGELFAGFKEGKKEDENKKILQKFLLKPTVKIVNVTIETAEIFGFVKKKLKQAGTPIPINDVWIAAHAFETSSTIITYDKHFQSIPGLRLWNIIE